MLVDKSQTKMQGNGVKVGFVISSVGICVTEVRHGIETCILFKLY